jgi:hypothetical protein
MKTGKVSLKTRNSSGKGKAAQADRDYKFSVLFFEHDGCWAAQCLEHDIATQAKTLQDLCHEVERVLVAHLAIAEELGQEPFMGIKKAPSEYWELFKKSQTQVSRPAIHKLKRKRGRIHPTFRVAERIAA